MRIRKLLFGLIILFAIPVGGMARAQGNLDNQSICLKTGGFFGRMVGDDAERLNISGELGFHIGITYSKYFHDKFALQVELNLTNVRVVKDYNLYTFRDTLHFIEKGSLLYLDIPILAKFPYPGFKRHQLSVYFGPYLGFNLSGNNNGKYTAENGVNISGGSFDAKIGNISRFDYGFVIGWDFRIPFLSNNLIVDIRYVMGQREIFEDKNHHPYKQNNVPFIDPITGKANRLTNRGFLISIGYVLIDLN